ncbi:MAG TPA: beta-ketoacyl-ACP synthase III, partial [Mobilitalea sp.]|nr:beta-ketoacyl-ACP synthase III [Mobilitalea sp.]
DDLSKMVDTSDEWIRTRTGIRERRISSGISTSDLAYEAGLRAIEDAGLKPEDIDLIICATITPDYFMPSCACMVQQRLGAKNAAAFDLAAACTGMIYGIVTAEQFIKSGMYRNVLVIGTEVLSKVLDWEDRSTCVLFGDGAGAVVMSQSDKGGVILASNLKADGSKYNLLTCPAVPLKNPYIGGGDKNSLIGTDNDTRSVIKMAGQEVFKFAVRTIIDNIEAVLRKTGLNTDDIRYIIPHQANQRIFEQASKLSGIAIERFYMNLDRYGNTSAASIGIALDELVKDTGIKSGDVLVLVGFGGGMTGGAVILKWD